MQLNVRFIAIHAMIVTKHDWFKYCLYCRAQTVGRRQF